MNIFLNLINDSLKQILSLKNEKTKFIILLTSWMSFPVIIWIIWKFCLSPILIRLFYYWPFGLCKQNCFACNRSQIISRSKINWWRCSYKDICGAWNGFDKEGDYLKFIPETVYSMANINTSNNVNISNINTNISTVTSSSILCHSCSQGQEKRLEMIANYSNQDMKFFMSKVNEISELCQVCKLTVSSRLEDLSQKIGHRLSKESKEKEREELIKKEEQSNLIWKRIWFFGTSCIRLIYFIYILRTFCLPILQSLMKTRNKSELFTTYTQQDLTNFISLTMTLIFCEQLNVSKQKELRANKRVVELVERDHPAKTEEVLVRRNNQSRSESQSYKPAESVLSRRSIRSTKNTTSISRIGIQSNKNTSYKLYNNENDNNNQKRTRLPPTIITSPTEIRTSWSAISDESDYGDEREEGDEKAMSIDMNNNNNNNNNIHHNSMTPMSTSYNTPRTHTTIIPEIDYKKDIELCDIMSTISIK